MNPHTSILPEIIATLNGISFILLVAGRFAIKAGRQALHRTLMLLAVLSSTFFLVFYLMHHYQVGSVPYPYHNWTRILYFVILIPHVILAAFILPFIVIALKHAFKKQLDKHRRVVRWLYPTWLYVSFTGLVVYVMLYQL
ncbi:DUF420 domain-containing protein [bacterium]|nr:DUF420 domain-containing protein [bacterium]